ncbi:MAG: hypothetical protein KatS3mg124_1207 [Porticoccaceae bacterium]|nr:MAG: hypothetical protein KatS3mg124_1207 [Porticoccaceae bacterium]
MPAVSPQVALCLSTLAPHTRTPEGPLLDELLDAAAEAGFRRVALSPGAAQAMGAAALGRALRARGLSCLALEGLVGWEAGAAAGRVAGRGLAELAAALSAPVVLAATVVEVLDAAAATEGLAAAAEALAETGAVLALEFIPGTAVPSLSAAAALAKRAGSAVGITLDLLHWHHQPGGPDWRALEALPPERLVYLQLCDAPEGPAPEGRAYLPFAMGWRLPPGEGVVDWLALRAALAARGARPAIAVEVFNERLAATGARAMARCLAARVAALDL